MNSKEIKKKMNPFSNSGNLFIGFMFIGLAIGLYLDNVAPFILGGMGVGYVVSYFAKK